MGVGLMMKKGLLKGLSISLALILMFIFTVEQASAATSFKDVPMNHWAHKSIHQATQKGYFKGYSDGTFRPNANVTRAEMIALLTRVLDLPQEGNYPFQDKEAAWAHNAIGQAIQAGIVDRNDYGAKFQPNTPTTRAELSKWMANALAYKNPEYKQVIIDTKDTLLPIPEYYRNLNKKHVPYIAVAMGTGLLGGYPDDTFRPNGNTTRAEVAVILSRLENVMKKQPTEFRDLEELRAVGVEGTNFHIVVENGMVLNGSDPFREVRNKKITFTKNNVGYAKMNRLIFFGGQTKEEMDSIYAKMFVDDTTFTHPNIVPFAIEKSFTAHQKYENNTYHKYKNGLNLLRLIVGDPMYGEVVKKYNLRAMPREEILNFMKENDGKPYWEYGTFSLDRSNAIIADDGSNYSIRINK